MVYDKFIVSLYCEKEVLPRGFVEIEKRNQAIHLSVFGGKGYLFVYSNEYAILRCDKKANCELKNFQFNSPYFFCFIEDNKQRILYGRRGHFENEEAIKAKFFEEYEKILNQSKFAFEPNFVVDGIIQKMFGKQVTSFFEHTKRQLSGLFACSKRATILEKIIPSSKFVETLSEGTKAYAGVVYKNKMPFAIGIGFCYADIDKLVSDSSYEYFFEENDKAKGYFLSFRRATDGDRVDIAY